MVDTSEYKYDIYEVDYSSLYTLFPSSPGTNFPNITFANNSGYYANSFELSRFIDSLKAIDIFTVDGVKKLEDVFSPGKPSDRYEIIYNNDPGIVRRKHSNSSTLSYLVDSFDTVLSTSEEITKQIQYPGEWVVLSNRKRNSELNKLFDDTWERQLLFLNNQVNDSYSHMGIVHSLERKSSEDPSFQTWLISSNVSKDVIAQINALISIIGSYETVTGHDIPSIPPNTSITFLTNDNLSYTLGGVYYSIEKITKDPRWLDPTPYVGQTLPWNKWMAESIRPRLDTGELSGRLVVPETANSSQSGEFKIKYKDIANLKYYETTIIFPQTFSSTVPAEYVAYFVPSNTNWKYTTDSQSAFAIKPKISQVANSNFKLSFDIPLSVKTEITKNKLFGEKELIIQWTVILKINSAILCPILINKHLGHMLSGYRDVTGADGSYTVSSVSAIDKKAKWSNNFLNYKVQYWTTGDKNLFDSFKSLISEIQNLYSETYDTTCEKLSHSNIYGDYYIFNGRLNSDHGSEISVSSRQLLQITRYSKVLSKKQGLPKLAAIIDARCPKVYSPAIDNSKCTLPKKASDFLLDTNPTQNSSTDVSTIDKVKTGKGKVLYILPNGAKLK